MKKATLFVLSLVLMGVLSPTSRSQVDTITILHFNDTHSNLAPIGPRDGALKGTLGGIARAATLIGMTRAENPNVLVLHAGDSFIGDLFFNKYFGIAELQMMTAVGFDAMTVGNHEFDLTPAVLQIALDTAFQAGGIPLLSANINLENDTVKGLKKYIQPYTVKQMGNVNVGIFGLTTPLTNQISQPAPAVVSDSIIQIATAMVDTLKAKGCRVVIFLSHLGVYYDGIIAQSVPGIHVIVGGHDHYAFEKPQIEVNLQGDTTYIVQANAFYLNAGKLQLAVSSNKVRLLGFQLINLDASIPEESTVAAMVDGLVADIQNTYGPLFTRRIGFAAGDIDEVVTSPMMVGSKDVPLGNLVADAFRAATGADIAIQVGGSMAQILFHGPLVSADIFRALGYGFNTDNGLGYRMATFNISGAALLGAMEFGLSEIELNDEFMPQVSGMRYAYNIYRQPGNRVILDSTFVGTSKLNPTTIYSVAANEFVPLFLETMGVSISDVRVFKDTTEFHIVSAFVEAQDTIRPMTDGRIKAYNITTSVRQSAELPASYQLEQNYPNPFNPSTVIAFEMPKASPVSLKVFNILGQEVVTVVEGNLNAGTHQYRFEGNDLTSGVYVYQLRAGGFVQTKKMILMK